MAALIASSEWSVSGAVVSMAATRARAGVTNASAGRERNDAPSDTHDRPPTTNRSTYSLHAACRASPVHPTTRRAAGGRRAGRRTPAFAYRSRRFGRGVTTVEPAAAVV